MGGSIPELVRALAARTGFTATYVEQRARQLQGAGLLPVANGRQHISAKPRDLTNLLLSLGAAKVRNAPATVNTYASLARLGEEKQRAGDALEELIASIWAGDRQARGTTISIVETKPKLIIGEHHFYNADTFMEFRGVDAVRRTLEIPCCIVAQIGAELGFSRCRDAI